MSTMDPWEYWGEEGREGELVDAEVARAVPELFAICQIERDEEGEPVAAHLMAWGIAMAEGTEVVSPGGGMRGSFQSVDRAMTLFSCSAEVCAARPPAVHAASEPVGC